MPKSMLEEYISKIPGEIGTYIETQILLQPKVNHGQIIYSLDLLFGVWY